VTIASFSSLSRAALAAALVAALAGCGYHFAASGAGLPASAETIYVDHFGNRSRNTGLNDQFVRFMKDEIENHKRLRLVDEPAAADLRLSGTILTEDSTPTTYNSVLEPTQYSDLILVEARLVDSHSNKVIWSGRMSSSAPYGVVSQAVVTTSPTFLQQNLRGQDISNMPDAQVAATQQASAEDQMMTDLAHNLYASMSEGF
jgi:lipopolysaccharide assembly LptE-like protein